ncbi:MAG: hypothetical protein IJY21_02795, partial [Clostridia bacterium]|nr:hypothetical protein [Clostridia bacterium]
QIVIASEFTSAAIDQIVIASEFTSAAIDQIVIASEFTSAAIDQIVIASEFTSAAISSLCHTAQPAIWHSQTKRQRVERIPSHEIHSTPQ